MQNTGCAGHLVLVIQTLDVSTQFSACWAVCWATRLQGSAFLTTWTLHEQLRHGHTAACMLHQECRLRGQLQAARTAAWSMHACTPAGCLSALLGINNPACGADSRIACHGVMCVLQEEVAQRLVDATPGRPDYRAMNIITHYYSKPVYRFK